MTGARAEILERIATALRVPVAPTAIPRAYERSLPAGVDRVARFEERVSDYRATVHQVDAGGVGSAIAAVARERGIARLVVPDGAPADWLGQLDGVDLVRDDPPLTVRALDTLDGVLTGAAVAIAETGTIVLDGGPGQGRRALSLLPDRHIVVVGGDQIAGTVAEALERLDPSRPLTWISGPSATSDIELQRIEGVHGPRVLDVIVVRGVRPTTVSLCD